MIQSSATEICIQGRDSFAVRRRARGLFEMFTAGYQNVEGFVTADSQSLYLVHCLMLGDSLLQLREKIEKDVGARVQETARLSIKGSIAFRPDPLFLQPEFLDDRLLSLTPTVLKSSLIFYN